VVFIVAQVMSFPQISTLPFSNVSVQSLPSVLLFLGFQMGLFGALFVLWLGQLLPQFIANKNP
jgi:riboflavin transporter FmnP